MSLMVEAALAFVYIATGFILALIFNEEEEVVWLYVILWPLIIVLAVVTIVACIINEICKTIYRLLRKVTHG